MIKRESCSQARAEILGQVSTRGTPGVGRGEGEHQLPGLKHVAGEGGVLRALVAFGN